ncbi:MAG: hypothetical protein CMF80_08985 [Candidatus Marinimicrobia bacterium]|nr:hypothetical protein [Candidatus Neomarinimicrobiota bacterium]
MFCYSFANPISIDSGINFILNTNDINNNNKNDVLCFENKAIVRNIEIYDVDNKSLNSFWKFSLPDTLIGYFTDATLVSFNNKTNYLLVSVALSNNNKSLFLFDVINGQINPKPLSFLNLPEKYIHYKNPIQLTTIDWDNDNDDEIAITFSSPFRSILICDFKNENLIIVDEIAKDFLSNSYSPILTGVGDLNGDRKDDIIVVDNGTKANARIYLNGMKKDGLRILGLKDIGQLSFLSKSSVNFDYDGGDEIFFASRKFGLHYIFVESIGMVNQAVTVKTELLIDDINKIYISGASSNNQIVTIDPVGKIGRYEIIKNETDLSVGIYENKTINFSIKRPNDISSIYFANSKQLVACAYDDIKSELYFYNHKSYIEPAVDYSLQRQDKRSPDVIVNSYDSTFFDIAWMDTLQFYEFKSKSLLDNMKFNQDKKSISWIPTVDNLGFNEIFYDISFKHTDNFESINEDTLTQVILNEKIITRSDSILIYVNDKPNIKDNFSTFDVFGGDDFTHKFLSVDKNVDSKLTYYFLNDSLNGITVDDSGYVSWKIPQKFKGSKSYDLCVDDSIEKDSIKINFNIHPRLYFSTNDTTYHVEVNEPINLNFKPDTVYSFNTYSYSIPNSPKNMSIDNNGNFSWIPNSSQIDIKNFFVVISDGKTSAESKISINVNDKPAITLSPPKIVHLPVGENFNFKFIGNDPNQENELVWKLLQGPEDMTLLSDGTLNWLSSGIDFVNYIIQLSDGYVYETFEGLIYVNAIPKIISDPPKTINLGDTLIYEIMSEDQNKLSYNNSSEKNLIEYKILSAPDDCFIKNNILKWPVSENYLGNNSINISISDGIEKDTQTFNIFVNDIPVLYTKDTLLLEVNKQFDYVLEVIDKNLNDVIDIDLINNSLGFELKKDTLSWKPDTSRIGSHNLKLRLSDGNINFENDYNLNFRVFSKPKFTNTPKKDAYVGLEFLYEPKINYFTQKSSSLEIVESSSINVKLNNNIITWIPDINDAKKEIHKIVLKASNKNKQSSTIEFFVKVHENPKIKN